MKFTLCLALLALSGGALQALTIDFASLSTSTPPATVYAGPGGGVFYNGSDSAGGFSAGGAFFNNDYTPLWNSWQGWAYSTTSDTSTAGFGNQYSAYASPTDRPYAVGYSSFARITLPSGFDSPVSITVANTSYAALSMLNGDPFTKKFGGVSGDDPDFFFVDFIGLDAAQNTLGSVRFHLADFRFADNTQDYVVSDWVTVDLTSLGSGVSYLGLAFGSSDTGLFGINTPTYLAVDSLSLVPEPGAFSLLAAAAGLLIALSRRRNS